MRLLSGEPILKHIRSTKEGQGEVKFSQGVGVESYNSVFQYGMVKQENTVVDKPIRTVISSKMLDSHSWQKLIGIASATDYSMQVRVLLPY